MYSQDALLVLMIALLASNGDFDLNNNNWWIIMIVLLTIGYPQFPIWNNGCGCGCNRNRLFLNTFWYIRNFFGQKMAE